MGLSARAGLDPADRVAGQFGPVGEGEFLANVHAVGIDRPGADHELSGDIEVSTSLALARPLPAERAWRK